MANAPDQLILYDAAVRQWIVDNFSACISGKTLGISIGTPDRAFSEFVTPTSIDPDGRLPMPRVALTLEDPERDPTRFQWSPIRKLGYTDSSNTTIRKAEYPVPVDLKYTLNFWAEYQREMNLFIQQFFFRFRTEFDVLTVDVDSIAPAAVYGMKDVELFLDGPFTNTGNIPDPGSGASDERELRRTANLTLRAWLWDFDFQSVSVLNEIEARFYSDEQLTTLLEVRSTPQRQTLGAGDGSTTAFTPLTLPHPELLPLVVNTVFVDAIIGGTLVRCRDNGIGGFTELGSPVLGLLVSGTVNYVTGEINITYSTAPDNSTDIDVGYFTTTAFADE